MLSSASHRVAPEVTIKSQSANTFAKLPSLLDVARTIPPQSRSNANSIKKKKVRQRTIKNLKEVSPLRQKLAAFLEVQWFTVVMLIVTVYALFGDDLRLCLFTRQADDTFFLLASICLVLFTFEFAVSCYAKPNYLFSFYFILDFIATFSVLPDIGWLWDAITGAGGNQNSSAIKASKATKAGSKAGRIVRVVRAIRLIRVVKILKWKHNKDEDPTHSLQESKVGSKMGEVTVQRVVVLVLFLIMCLPIFDGGYSQPEYRYQDYGLRSIHLMISSGLASPSSLEYQRLFSGYVRDAGLLLFLQITNQSIAEVLSTAKAVRFQPADQPWADYTLSTNPTTGWTASSMFADPTALDSLYRTVELNVVQWHGCYSQDFVRLDSGSDDSKCISSAIFSLAESVTLGAAYNILKTIFIIMVLIFSSTSFIRNTRVLVLEPIERMMNTIQKLAENPLASVQTTGTDDTVRKNAKEEGFETALLELTLSKVGTLMQVGFGAAGADIIGKNMGSGDLDPMLPGKKITAIYGFCDIRQFTDTTECLQEEVMVYVNKLGNIMHTGTHHYYGMANKNVGDAFLLSWKICNGELPCFARFSDSPTENDRLHVNETIRCPTNPGAGSVLRAITPTEMADSALTAFIKCMIDLDNANTDGPLTEYLKNPVVIKRFGPNFRIKMGFGMHVGWAVEGAIGSRFKIDATYISPHVEMADRLEAGSKIFMTPINLSHWFVALLSPAARKFVRKMDRISIRGVDTPLTVYTFDVTVSKQGFGTPKFHPATGEQYPVDFENDREYLEIREGLEPEFLLAASSGVEAYLNGDWAKAKDYILEAQSIRPSDGPCKYLMNFMKQHNFVTPIDWKGYHKLSGY